MIFRLKWIFDVGFRHLDKDTRRLPGWGLHVGFASFIAVWCITCFALQLPQKLILGLLPVFGILDIVCTCFLLRHAVRNLQRLGLFAIDRPRFWIELAAVTLTLGFSLGIFLVTGGIPGVGKLNLDFRLLHLICPLFIYSSFGMTAVAIILGLLTGGKARGRSPELTLFFFWLYIATFPIAFIANLGDEEIGIAIAVAGLLVAAIAGITYLAGWNIEIGNPEKAQSASE